MDVIRRAWAHTNIYDLVIRLPFLGCFSSRSMIRLIIFLKNYWCTIQWVETWKKRNLFRFLAFERPVLEFWPLHEVPVPAIISSGYFRYTSCPLLLCIHKCVIHRCDDISYVKACSTSMEVMSVDQGPVIFGRIKFIKGMCQRIRKSLYYSFPLFHILGISI